MARWNRRFAGLGFLVAVVVSLIPTAAASARPISDCSRMTVVGHRGLYELTPTTENTRAAWAAALADGASGVEGDIRLTEDHRFVLMHDPTIDRTMAGHGLLSSYTFAQVGAMTMADGSHPRIAVFAAVAKMHSAYPRATFSLELKETMSNRNFARLGWHLRHLGVRKLTTITSFDPSLLARFAAQNKGRRSFKTALISNHIIDAATAAKYRGGVVISGLATGLTAAYVDSLHAAGVSVASWYPNQTDAGWSNLVTVGVDAFVANDPARALQLCQTAA